MEGQAVRSYMRMKEYAMKGGSEHRVALWRGTRVLKDLETRAQATESLFDYLTDHLLANHLFGDDTCLEGFYEDDGMLHVVISQPLVIGRHPAWRELVEGLERQGLALENPDSRLPVFQLDGGAAGMITVLDLHENNVIVAKEGGFLHPIDAHFYFDDQAARIEALNELGIFGRCPLDQRAVHESALKPVPGTSSPTRAPLPSKAGTAPAPAHTKAATTI